MSDESIKSIKAPSTSANILHPSLNYVDTKIIVEFKGSCKQDKISFNHWKIVNIWIVYDFNISSYLTLKNCFSGAVRLTKNLDIDQYKNSGHGIGLNRKEFFSLGNEIGRNVIIFGADMSSTPHIHNKKKDILILSKGSQGLEHCTHSTGLYKLRARWRACMQRGFPSTRLRARKSIKTLLSSAQKLFKWASCFCVWMQIFGTTRSDVHNLFQLRSCY